MDVRILVMMRLILTLSLTHFLEIKAENVFFSTPTENDRLKPVLDSEPAPSIRKIKKFTTVISQPLHHNYKWNDKKKAVADWPIHLNGFGHGKAFFLFCASCVWGS